MRSTRRTHAAEPRSTGSGVLALGRARSLNPTAHDYGFAFAASAIVLALGALIEPDLRHTLVIPVLLGGTLAAADAVRMLERRLDTFDPQAVLSMFAFYFFVIAPVLQVIWHYELPYVDHPRDIRPWMELACWYAVAGLVVFRVVLALWQRFVGLPRAHVRWEATPRLLIVLGALVALSALTFAVVIIDSGGIVDYIDRARLTKNGLQGYGWALLIAESLPVVLFFAVVLWLRGRALGLWAMVTLLAGYGVVCVVTVGLRGSRGNVVFALLLGVGIIHLFVRRVPVRLLVIGTLAGVLFMWAFGYYKDHGSTLFQGPRSAVVAPNYSLKTVLLGNFARNDIQALELWRLEHPASEEYGLRDGATYVGDVAGLIPSKIIGDRPETKLQAATHLLFGKSVQENGYPATYTYGLAGEWMLNFPATTIPIAFAIFALACAVAFRWARGLARDDARIYFVPLLGILAILGLASDLDNLLYAALGYGLLPGLALVVGARRLASGVGAR